MAESGKQLPCNADGVCMVCNKKPEAAANVMCTTCATPWHAACLSQTLAITEEWSCPDCTIILPGDAAGTSAHPPPPPALAGDDASSGLVAAIRAIQEDPSLSDQEKAAKRQCLLSGGVEASKKGKKTKVVDDDEDEKVLKVVGDELSCSFCLQLLDRPVTTHCGHNFCLRCFEKWIGQGKRTCARCREHIPQKMAKQPRINAALVAIIRAAKMGKSKDSVASDKLQHFVHNQDRPDKPFTTERAKRGGKANAASGKIFVTTPHDYFGPILPEYDDARGRGVLVGDCWEGRLECRQWGVHMPPVAGIAGQKNHGAQSVVLSGGYEDDEDHGEWFLYTGSGGRDLSGNKRTNKEQSSDQKFESFNEALRVSCRKGYPVRVVRSFKEKRSSYAPETGLRYDGIYRIEKCWLKTGKQGYKVCRYLFMRCDNSPAPWTSNEHGDKVRPLPVISELENATNVTERAESPSWDYDEEEGSWKWMKPPPASKLIGAGSCSPGGKKVKPAAMRKGRKDKILKGLSCLLCTKVMKLPLTTPCAHNFCKHCLEGHFAGKSHVRERTSLGGRTLRTQRNVMTCPSCPTDISEFLLKPQVNRDLQGVIEGLQDKDCDEEAVMECSSDTEESEGTHAAAEDELNSKNTESEGASKKLKIDGVDGLSKMDSADQKESREAQEARDGESASPSSTLNVQSDGEML